jgi:hypothetical protein
LPPTRHPLRSEEHEIDEDKDEREEKPEPVSARPTKKPRRKFDFSRYGIWLIVVVVVFCLVFGASIIFTGATVTVTPRQQIVNVNIAGLARKTLPANQANANAGTLEYDTATLGMSQTTNIPSTGVVQVQKKATGTIVVYNNFSSASQRLIKNTRFETPGGLIYRIDHSVTVPGKNASVPGSVETIVIADMAGENYNIGLTDFTIPGFKGDSRYTGFYARSKTPMAGGFVGTVPTASTDKLNAAYSAMEANLKNSILTKLRAETPADFVMFDSAVVSNFDRPLPIAGAGNTVAVTEYATSTAIIFKRANFAGFVATQAIPEFDKSPVTIANMEKVSFSPQIPAAFQIGDPIQFGVKGSVLFVWNFDEAKLKSMLVGKPKKDVAVTLQQFSGIDKIEAVIRPFWRMSFPDDSNKISITQKVTYPESSAASH